MNVIDADRVSRISAIVVAAIMWSANIQCLAVDQVIRKSDNVTLRGEFSAMTPEAITIKLSNGKEEVVSVADIKNLRFDQEPALFAQAQSNERSGALDSALEKYRQIQSDGSGADKRVGTELQFLIARTQVKQAQADPSKREDALKAIQEFRTASKTNFRYLEATLLEAFLIADSDAAASQALLQEVKASSVKGFQLQAGVQLGRLLLQTGDGPGAMQAFEQVVQQSAGDPGSEGAHFDGMLGKAMCQQQLGQVNEAILALDEVISKASEADTRVLAEAWIQKGDCLKQRNEPKAALMAYLHVDVLYSSEPAEHAQALFRLSQLWGGAGHQDRGQDAADRLREKYPNSTWVSQLKAD